jgi:hypothetical protein
MISSSARDVQEAMETREKQGLDIKWRLNRITGVDEKAGRWRGDFEMLIGWEHKVSSGRPGLKTGGVLSPGDLRKRSLIGVSHALEDAGGRHEDATNIQENITAELDLFISAITHCKGDKALCSFMSFEVFKEQFHLLHEFFMAEVSFYDVDGPRLLFSESHNLLRDNENVGERFIQISRPKTNTPGDLIIWFHSRYICEIEAEFDFHDFPFDFQKFTIHGRIGSKTTGYEFR